MFALGDLVQMKKPHACGTNRWEILRVGMDIRIKCMGCGHMIMMPRQEFTKKMKKVLTAAADVAAANEPHYVQPRPLDPPNTGL
ncbi:DUF951 family protein [Schleiferilactobacillus harbinensis]|mgnify:CR=1 FL=1|jgi:hypothetical protein|uniref:DUF951 domain-containing protein n=2 Tax=Schleiferilactobacillus harbinensis TaxID=304207 RepID=A0A510TXT7_9LACO|nr:DUF951 domain-containing protein [Schleiferilactobacillus harbinensis]HAY52938.1 DUF951 domain-containing protein [Lactobacillus sp.]KRM25636.1 hypothetical protein FC91_GL000551 [Schleiferilactobacillus harbinensis DSM 16991]MBO3092322.1 DUF951 domain-containing protein [Schleiferilactobacillus harbinensis]MCI1688066.1 DUF951 domain-containing protein [Schleiferilactobacillus harbinensis]MCI1783174.1 DUF951 domain-containing protein [Schleiferilactobacillus harbinensis]